MGQLVIVNVIDFKVYNTRGTLSGWEELRTDNNTYVSIPSQYKPSSRIITGGGSTSGANTKDVQLNIDSDYGHILVKNNLFSSASTSENETVSATFVYFTDTRTTTNITWNSSSTLYTGDDLIATLKAGNTPLSNKQVVFYINGSNYVRTTDNNGQVSLGLNLNSYSNSGYINYSFTISFNGDNTYAPSGTGNQTLKLNYPLPTIACTNPITDNRIYIKKSEPITGTVKNNNGKPLRNITVTVEISGATQTYTGKTDNDGVFRIYRPNDGLNYNDTTQNGTYISIQANPLSQAKQLTVSPTPTYYGY